MALWMEAGSEPLSEHEKADLEGIAVLKEDSAFELKEQGNEYVKKGKKHYSDAIDCYTRAINQKVLNEQDTSILYSNKAHVNLLLGNNRRALEDAQHAIKLSPTNIKAFYRAAKASFSLDLLKEAKSYCARGLELSPDNVELKKLVRQIDVKVSEGERHKAEVSKALTAAKDLVAAFDDRGLKIGKAMYRELIGLKKPVLDSSKILHWPVLLLYAEVMSSDLIEDFCEIDMFSSHIDMMFSESCPPLSWDKDHAYTRDSIELYYEVGSAVCLSKGEILSHLLEGTAAAGVENFNGEKDSSKQGNIIGGHSKWAKVDERRTLHDVLREAKCVIPGIPVFYVVSKRSSFYKDFKAGKWTTPPSHDEDND